jgi:hypothetical protein
MKYLLVTAALLLVVNIGFSANFKLKDGTTISGKIVSTNATSITIEDERGNTTSVKRDYLVNPPAEKNEPVVDKAPAVDPGPPHHLFGITFVHAWGTGVYGFRSQYDAYLGINIYFPEGALANGASLSYEFMIIPWLSLGTCVTYWTFDIVSTTKILNDIYLMAHPFKAEYFDLYAGIGIVNEITSDPRFAFDFPVKIGVNIWLGRNFALRAQAETRIKSIKQTFGQWSLGAVFAF